MERREAVSPFEKLSNFRDAGGLATADGRTLRTGMLFRSDDPSRMSGLDVLKLREFELKLICDLRSPKESRKKPPRLAPEMAIHVVNIPLHDPETHDVSRTRMLGFLFGKTGGERFLEFCRGYYHHLAFERMFRVREVFTLLAAEDSFPALIHCTAGKDRTGLVTALIQLLVGVPYELVREDYLRTNEYFRVRLERLIRVTRAVTLHQVSTERMRVLMAAHPELLDGVYGEIVRKYGSVERYLLAGCEVDPGTLREIRSRLLA